MSCSSKNCLFVWRVKHYCTESAAELAALPADSNGFELYPGAGAGSCTRAGSNVVTLAGRIKVEFVGLDCTRTGFAENNWFVGTESADSGPEDGGWSYWYYRSTKKPDDHSASAGACGDTVIPDGGTLPESGDNPYDIDHDDSDDCSCSDAIVNAYFDPTISTIHTCEWAYQHVWKTSPLAPLPTPTEGDRISGGCATRTGTWSATGTESATSSFTATGSVEYSNTFTVTATGTLSTPSSTGTDSATSSETGTFTATVSETPSLTASSTPSFTATSPYTYTFTSTPSGTSTETLSFTPSETATATSTFTDTVTLTVSESPTLTATGTQTVSVTVTETATSTESYVTNVKMYKCEDVQEGDDIESLRVYNGFIRFGIFGSYTVEKTDIWEKVDAGHSIPVEIDGTCYTVFEVTGAAGFPSYFIPNEPAEELYGTGDSYSSQAYGNSFAQIKRGCNDFCPTATFTATSTVEESRTVTATATQTLSTSTWTATETLSVTPSETATLSHTNTTTDSVSHSPTETATLTNTVSATPSVSGTVEFSQTYTGTDTATETLTATLTESHTFTATATVQNIPIFAVLGMLPSCGAKDMHHSMNQIIRLPEGFSNWRNWNNSTGHAKTAFTANSTYSHLEDNCYMSHWVKPTDDWRPKIPGFGPDSSGVFHLDLSRYKESCEEGACNPDLILVWTVGPGSLAECNGNADNKAGKWFMGPNNPFPNAPYIGQKFLLYQLVQKWLASGIPYLDVINNTTDIADAEDHVEDCSFCTASDTAKIKITVNIAGSLAATKTWKAADHLNNCGCDGVTTKALTFAPTPSESVDSTTALGGTYGIKLENENTAKDDWNKFKFYSTFKSESILRAATDSKIVDITKFKLSSAQNATSPVDNVNTVYSSVAGVIRNFHGASMGPNTAKLKENILSGVYGGQSQDWMQYREKAPSEVANLTVNAAWVQQKLFWRMALGSQIKNTFEAGKGAKFVCAKDTDYINCTNTDTFKNTNTKETGYQYLWAMIFKPSDGSGISASFPTSLIAEETKSVTLLKASEMVDEDGELLKKMPYDIFMYNKGIGALDITKSTTKIYKSSSAASIGNVLGGLPAKACSNGNDCAYISNASWIGETDHLQSYMTSANPQGDGPKCNNCSTDNSGNDSNINRKAGGAKLHLVDLHKDHGMGFYTVEHVFWIHNRPGGKGKKYGADEVAWNVQTAGGVPGPEKTTLRFTVEIPSDFGVPVIPSVPPTLPPGEWPPNNNGGWW